MINIADDIVKCREAKEWKVVVFLDVCKAYDSVWIKGLLWKLLKRGVPLIYVKWIQAWLACRFVYVACGGRKSAHREISIGLPQGGVLSCLLWLIYVDDLPEKIGNLVFTELFADDVALHPCKYGEAGHIEL